MVKVRPRASRRELRKKRRDVVNRLRRQKSYLQRDTTPLSCRRLPVPGASTLQPEPKSM
jgi:hypothetical protein